MSLKSTTKQFNPEGREVLNYFFCERLYAPCAHFVLGLRNECLLASVFFIINSPKTAQPVKDRNDRFL